MHALILDDALGLPLAHAREPESCLSELTLSHALLVFSTFVDFQFVCLIIS